MLWVHKNTRAEQPKHKRHTRVECSSDEEHTNTLFQSVLTEVAAYVLSIAGRTPPLCPDPLQQSLLRVPTPSLPGSGRGEGRTLQAVERGEQVEQRHPGGAPGEEPKGPGESQEQGEAGHALQVPQQTAADARWPVGPHATDLHQHHPKHLQRARH